MKIYVITDTHLGHDKLVDMGHGRPIDFTQQILDNLERLNRPEFRADLLIHLGDVCIGKDEYHHELFLNRAKAAFKKVILVRGNHDNKSDAWYYRQGWDFVCREFINKYYGKAIMFTHAPLPKEHLSGLDFNVHGHYHGTAERSHRHEGTMLGGGTYDHSIHKDAAPEIYGYSPVNLEKLICK